VGLTAGLQAVENITSHAAARSPAPVIPSSNRAAWSLYRLTDDETYYVKLMTMMLSASPKHRLALTAAHAKPYHA
jgi:hypothetical protein